MDRVLNLSLKKKQILIMNLQKGRYIKKCDTRNLEFISDESVDLHTSTLCGYY